MQNSSKARFGRHMRLLSAACAIVLSASLGLSNRSGSEAHAEILTQLPSSHAQIRPQLRALRAVEHQSPERSILLASETFALMRVSGEEALGGMIEQILSRDDLASLLPAKLMLADLYQYQHRFDDALALLASLEPDASESVAYWRLRANLYRIGGQLEHMANACGRGAAIEPDPWLLLCQAELSALRGDFDGVLKMLDAIDADPSHRVHQQAELLIWIADLFDRTGRVATAARYFRKALLIGPSPYVVDRLIQFQLVSEGVDSASRTLRWWKDNGNAPAASWQLSAGLIAAATGNRLPAAQLLSSMEQDLSVRSLIPGATAHWRELARLSLALDPTSTTARHYALKNWRQQKEPIDAALLAQAASAGRHFATLEQLSTELRTRGMSGLLAELKLKGWL